MGNLYKIWGPGILTFGEDSKKQKLIVEVVQMELEIDTLFEV